LPTALGVDESAISAILDDGVAVLIIEPVRVGGLVVVSVRAKVALDVVVNISVFVGSDMKSSFWPPCCFLVRTAVRVAVTIELTVRAAVFVAIAMRLLRVVISVPPEGIYCANAQNDCLSKSR
jgi:hypothetical protein